MGGGKHLTVQSGVFVLWLLRVLIFLLQCFTVGHFSIYNDFSVFWESHFLKVGECTELLSLKKTFVKIWLATVVPLIHYPFSTSLRLASLLSQTISGLVSLSFSLHSHRLMHILLCLVKKKCSFDAERSVSCMPEKNVQGLATATICASHNRGCNQLNTGKRFPAWHISPEES